MPLIWIGLGLLGAWAVFAHPDVTAKTQNAINVLRKTVIKYNNISDIPPDLAKQVVKAFDDLACPTVANALRNGIKIDTLPPDQLATAKLELKSLEARGIDI